MNNLQKLIDIIKQNPDLRVVPIVDSEIVASENYGYWVGSIGKSKVTNIHYGEERYYLGEDEEELIEEYMDANYESPLSDEELEKQAEEEIKNYKWEKVIVVYIDLP